MRPNVPDAVVEYVKSLPENERIAIVFVFNDSQQEERWTVGPDGMEPPDWDWTVTIRGIGSTNRSLVAQESDRSPRSAIGIAIIDGTTEIERKAAASNPEWSQTKREKRGEYYANGLKSLKALQAVVEAEWPMDSQ